MHRRYAIPVSHLYRSVERITALYILSFVDSLMVFFRMTFDSSRPGAWLAFCILGVISLSSYSSAEIVLPRVVHALHLDPVDDDVWLGPCCVWSTVFLTLIVSPKCCAASANLSTFIYMSTSLCAMRAQSSANSASMMTFSTVLVWAERRRRSQTEPCG